MNGHRADRLILDEAHPLQRASNSIQALNVALKAILEPALHKCRRCDYKNGELEHQCNECAAYEQRHAFCLCGHTVPMHHNGMGCLATMAGELCDCTELDLTPQPRPEEMIA